VGIHQAGQHEPAREDFCAGGRLTGETAVGDCQLRFVASVKADSAHNPAR
jgi:hypothetical protein